ncbi:hypothetical protein T07_860 [Trichinella nelsoni]|uniref:Uncharacterized protein n=1 Tax=Trichinella nelsoni TaxID=6336 RepID=A0A0V0RPN8_9BILA|nr:hypothetical protein T07_860 [Trichinella nelsoni]
MQLLCSLKFRNKNSRTVSAVLPTALTHTAHCSHALTMFDIKELNHRDGPTWAQFCSHSVPLFIYWSLSSLFY